MKIEIWHNPRCSTSRQVLALLREAGHEPEIVEYLATPPSADRIRQVLAQAGLEPRQLVREKEAASLGLDLSRLSGEELVEAMHRHPVLIQRPVVVTPEGAWLCRPKERVHEILRDQTGERQEPRR
jgi:arsenate reductase